MPRKGRRGSEAGWWAEDCQTKKAVQRGSEEFAKAAFAKAAGGKLWINNVPQVSGKADQRGAE